MAKHDNVSVKAALGFRSANKDVRKRFHIKQKQARDAIKREERFKRRKEEDANPELREIRRQKNKPHTIDSKRKWDEIAGENGENFLGLAVDLEQLQKKRRIEASKKQEDVEQIREQEDVTDFEGFDNNEEDEIDNKPDGESDDESVNSWLDESDSGIEDHDHSQNEDGDISKTKKHKLVSSVTTTASTSATTPTSRSDVTHESLVSKFSSLFNPPENTKVLITTSLNSTLHQQAEILTTVFPNSDYVRRTAHRFGHKYSVKEIASFASNRQYTTMIILMEDQKKPCGLDVVHLPSGPMFHFSISNWVEGHKLPGHGNATDHNPELILHNFKTPLGVLTASLFRTMFPRNPELQGRQVVTLHNQRDYIFVRRHRYIFRNKRATEKSITDTEGNAVKGVEDIRAGLQELGPRFTLKLRRVDRGIQRSSGQEWEWRGKTDRIRTKFQL